MDEQTSGNDDVEVVVTGTPLEATKGVKGDRGQRGLRGKPGADAPTDNNLLEELKRVQSDLKFRKRVRLFLLVLAVAVIAALASALVSVIALVSVLKYQDEACDRDNALRKAYTNQWTPVLAESPPPEKPPKGSPQEVIDTYDRQVRMREAFVDGLSKGFAQHRC